MLLVSALMYHGELITDITNPLLVSGIISHILDFSIKKIFIV